MVAGLNMLDRSGELATLFSPTLTLPAIVSSSDSRAQLRFLEFFASTLRNPHTRRAYARAVADFLTWCDAASVPSIAAVQPLHVAS